MTEYQIGDLRDYISEKRSEMIATATIEGFTSEETIKVSQELDELINQYHRLVQNKKRETPSFHQYIKQTLLFFYGSRFKLHNLS
ncbi:aspartyl-phosphate phosphatase Spo0E family protein [Bacillus sp. PS06]|nr:aspartyl-phosphate phosphatase Spo0E family protein [Bacillus sp. PS06]